MHKFKAGTVQKYLHAFYLKLFDKRLRYFFRKKKVEMVLNYFIRSTFLKKQYFRKLQNHLMRIYVKKVLIIATLKIYNHRKAHLEVLNKTQLKIKSMMVDYNAKLR